MRSIKPRAGNPQTSRSAAFARAFVRRIRNQNRRAPHLAVPEIAGIGENSPEIRAAACQRLAWLGVEIDSSANAASAPVISTPSSRVKVRVIATDEERMIASHAAEVVRSLGTAR